MKYLVPVTMTISGHIEVEIPGKITNAKKLRALKLAKKAYDGINSIQAPVIDVDYCDEMDATAMETEEG